MKILCISGKAQSGKDTFAEIFKDIKLNNRVLIAHYGDLLKYICKTFFDWDGKKDEKGRSLLQYVGTEKIRKKIPNFWANFLSAIMSIFHNEWDYVIIADCRFKNEIKMLKSKTKLWEHLSVRIERPNFDNGLTDKQKTHSSEISLDNYKFDYKIYNDGDLIDYRTKIEKLIKDNEI